MGRLSLPDIVVYGGTAAGITAAIAAAERGAATVLVSPSRRLGGMTTGGLGATDTGDLAAIGGLARRLYREIGSHYGSEESFRFEPHVAEAVLTRWIRQARVEVVAPVAFEGVEKKGRAIGGIALSGGRTIVARTFVDASYEGDLMARAGVQYRVGRESSAEHGESLNGVQGKTERHQFDVPVDPYVVPGHAGSGLLRSVEGGGEPRGSADRRIEAYNFRLCLTLDESNRLPLPKPERYDARRYELLARLIEGRRSAGKPVRFSDLFMIVALPNAKTDVNAWGAFSTDHIGANHDYPDADAKRRGEIWLDHVEFIRGLFHFLATDPRVPAGVRREATLWGLCRDEFPETGGWPHQLYVRESRRMLGETVVTQSHCEGRRVADDPVAIAAFLIDTHNCRRIVREGLVENEGDVEVLTAPFPIGYGTLVPKPEDCENLLVPVCVSATHTAYGSLRTEPVFMELGEAAGLAAAQAAELRRAVQEVDRTRLRRELEERGAVLNVELGGRRSEPWPHERFRYESDG